VIARALSDDDRASLGFDPTCFTGEISGDLARFGVRHPS